MLFFSSSGVGFILKTIMSQAISFSIGSKDINKLQRFYLGSLSKWETYCLHVFVQKTPKINNFAIVVSCSNSLLTFSEHVQVKSYLLKKFSRGRSLLLITARAHDF